MHRPAPRILTRLRDERGSLSTYFVSAVFATIPLVGLVVDGGGQVRAMQQANDVAAETARYAGQSINKGCAIWGAEITVPQHQAQTAAEEFVATHTTDVTLTDVRVTEGGHTVTVEATRTWEPIFLGILGVGPREVEGTGSAYQYRTDGSGEEYDPDVNAFGACQ